MKEEIDTFNEDDVQFKPRIVTWSCPYCDNDFKRKECVSDGKYCAMNHISQNQQGKDIIYEDLREICLYNILERKGQTKLWWDYMENVH